MFQIEQWAKADHEDVDELVEKWVEGVLKQHKTELELGELIGKLYVERSCADGEEFQRGQLHAHQTRRHSVHKDRGVGMG